MEINQEKIVDFDKYCNRCTFKDLPEEEDPCFDCLRESVNAFTHRPTEFKERTGKELRL